MSKSNIKDIISSLVMSKHDKSNLMQLLNKVENNESSGGGIQIVDSEEKLNSLNVPVGSLAAVAVPGTIKESSFRDLYQPDASILDQSTGTITNPEILSGVSSIKVTAPEGNIEGVNSGVYIIPRDFSTSNMKMISVEVLASNGIVTGVRAEGMVDGFINLALITYNDGVPTVDNSAIETINNYLASGDWCYLGSPAGGFIITEEQFATLDKFIHPVVGVPSIADIYIKKDSWEKYHQKDIDNIYDILSQKDNVINIVERVNNYNSIKPNVYYKITTDSTDTTFILEDADNNSIYNEYIIELRSNVHSTLIFKKGTENVNIKWANGVAPSVVSNVTYVISIVNNLGVYAMFPTI